MKIKNNPRVISSIEYHTLHLSEDTVNTFGARRNVIRIVFGAIMFLCLVFLCGYIYTSYSQHIVPYAPQYYEAYEAMQSLVNKFKDYVDPLLTYGEMDLPLLDHYSRHLVAILNVVLQASDELYRSHKTNNGTWIVFSTFSLDYRRNINKSALEGFIDPQKVVLEYKNLYAVFKNRTELIHKLILDKCYYQANPGCNREIQGIVDEGASEQDLELVSQAGFLFAAATAAQALDKKFGELLKVSVENLGLHYIINGEEELSPVIQKGAYLFHLLFGL